MNTNNLPNILKETLYGFSFEELGRNGSLLKDLHPDLQNDKEVVLQAVKARGASSASSSLALEFASEALRNDKEVVLTAVRYNAHALRFASETLKGDKEVVREAMQKNFTAYQYASEDLRNDKEFAIEVIKKSARPFEFVSRELKKDKEFMLAAVENEVSISEAPDSMQPFLKAYITLKNNPIQHTDNDIAKCTDMLLKQSKKLFTEGKVDQEQLAKALNKANSFIDDPGKKEINSYGQFVKEAMKSPNSGMQLLGKIMMALSVAVIGLGATLAATGIGAAPGAAVGLIGLGLFAGGARLSQKETSVSEEKEVISTLLKP